MTKWIAALFVAAALLTGCATMQAAGPDHAPRFVAVGYVSAFKGLDATITRTDFSRYTHIDLAFVNPGPDGAVVAGDSLACMAVGGGRMATLAQLRSAVDTVHRAGAKVLVSVGGGTIPACSGDWAALTRPGMREVVVRNLLALVDAQGLDGIDVDLEWAVLTSIDRAGDYTPFVATLAKGLRKRGKLLSCATASGEGGMIPVSSIPWFDLVNVMSYDAIGPSWGQAGAEHATLEQARRDLQLWRARGVPRDRLVLGVPFYGYGFGGYLPNYAYRDLASQFGADDADVVGERCAGCSYVTFNGVATLRAKAQLAREQAGGVMVWEVGQDTDDGRLIRALTGPPPPAD